MRWIVADGESGTGTFLIARDIHVHMPERNVGKGGPSTGTTIIVRVTGEISLVEQVFQLKEKILAVHCTGIITIVVPTVNGRVWPRVSRRRSASEILHEVFRGKKIAKRQREMLPIAVSRVGDTGLTPREFVHNLPKTNKVSYVAFALFLLSI
ncbi:hypothetical protein C8R45DRAFT_947778 [Mycena sanguinolenta]|nr:hypothetical protein C8R45DRAFT_947778 [Mycena sanguinolenta]